MYVCMHVSIYVSIYLFIYLSIYLCTCTHILHTYTIIGGYSLYHWASRQKKGVSKSCVPCFHRLVKCHSPKLNNHLNVYSNYSLIQISYQVGELYQSPDCNIHICICIYIYMNAIYYICIYIYILMPFQ